MVGLQRIAKGTGATVDGTPSPDPAFIGASRDEDDALLSLMRCSVAPLRRGAKVTLLSSTVPAHTPSADNVRAAIVRTD